MSLENEFHKDDYLKCLVLRELLVRKNSMNVGNNTSKHAVVEKIIIQI